MKHAIYNMYNTIFITDSPENAFDTHKPVENSKLFFQPSVRLYYYLFKKIEMHIQFC
jgi:hypothetical protein